ncbi:MAG: DedA family protein [Candidatus Micrarchaeaceae archaeon]
MPFLSIYSLLHLTSAAISSLVNAYGYYAILILMTLESASMPVPSEVVLPTLGYFAARGTLNLYIVLAVTYASSLIGMAINYYIAYFIGKDIVYKHLSIFRIKKEQLDAFDAWFAKNGPFAVFISRLIPLVRGLINFPAGFALMPWKKFYGYSMLGSIIWDTVLVLFGFYALSTSNIVVTSVAIAAFAIVLYIIYKAALNRVGSASSFKK